MRVHTVIASLKRLRQEAHAFKAGLDHSKILSEMATTKNMSARPAVSEAVPGRLTPSTLRCDRENNS